MKRACKKCIRIYSKHISIVILLTMKALMERDTGNIVLFY